MSSKRKWRKKATNTELSSRLIRYLPVVSTILIIVAISGLGVKLLQQSRAATVCTVSAKLVNSCRPWLGAFANDYPGISGIKAEIAQHESLIGRQVDIVHTYHTLGSLPLSNNDKSFISRPNTILLTSWKPAGKWADAGGGNATVNATIKTVADSFKSTEKAYPGKKIMFVIWHEPENDVSSGATGCTTRYRGSAGTPAQYRAMWANVRRIFDAEGVNNVVWTIIYQGFKGLDCMKDDMWPGNNLVDWVMWDSYLPNNTYTWDTQVGGPYAYFTSHSDATHDYLSKPWGLGEFGAGHDPDGGGDVADQPHTYKFYDDAKAGLDTNKYPRLKAYTVFDSRGFHDAKIAYETITMRYDPTELAHYKAFANDPRFTNAFYEGGGTTPPPPPPADAPPTVNLTAPTAGTTVSGSAVPLTATATDDNAVSKVVFAYKLHAATTWTTLATDTTSPYSTAWNTTTLTDNAQYDVRAVATDSASQTATDSATVTVKTTVSPPADTTPPTVSITSPTAGATISGTTTITGTASDNVGVKAVNLRVDDKYISSDGAAPFSFSLDTTSYTDGSHTINLRAFDDANNQTDKTITVTIKNTVSPPPPPPPSGTGDANGDSRINALDLSIVLSHDGQNYGPADFNHDGTVGSADLAILLGHWTW